MAKERRRWIPPAVLCLVVAALWAFPEVWYTKQGIEKPVWFVERTEVEAWDYEAIPVSESAEKALVADQTVNGEFRRDGKVIRVFSAKRYKEKANEIGLFVHTPDRCWVQGGWRIEPASPELVEIDVHGVRLMMERRLFDFRGQRELVYFCGLVGGQALPYRLDHNLSVGMRTALKENVNAAGTAARASDAHFWARLWSSFASRRALDGPKQFFRISTPLYGGEFEAADDRIREFMGKWLVPGEYGPEQANFRALAKN